jgi:hypothetical protein
MKSSIKVNVIFDSEMYEFFDLQGNLIDSCCTFDEIAEKGYNVLSITGLEED